MRILVWGSSWLRDPNAVLRLLFVSSMEAAGHQVIACDVASLGAVFGCKMMQHVLLTYARAYRIEAALVFPGAFVEAETLAALREMGVALVTFRYDDLLHFSPALQPPHPSELPYLQAFDRLCHLSTSPIQATAGVFAAASLPGPVYVKWPSLWQAMPVGDGPVRPVITFSGAHKTRPGGPESWRTQAIRALVGAGLPVEVHGAGWQDIPDLGATIRLPPPKAETAGSLIPHGLHDFIRTIHTSQINLSLFADWLPVSNPGMRDMPLEIAACGSMVLTNASAELADIFRYGEEVAVFETLDEMVDQARYFLARPEACQEMGRRAREASIRHGGWDVWWATVAEHLAPLGVTLPLDSPPVAPDPACRPVLQMAASALAHAYEGQGDALMAAEYFREVLHYAPDDYAALTGLARLGAAEDGVALWRTAALSVSPIGYLGHAPLNGLLGLGREWPGAYQFEALCNWLREALRTGRFDEAETVGLHLAPISPNHAIETAGALSHAGRSQAAMAVLNAVLAEWPAHLEALRERGDLHFAAGQYQRADQDYLAADRLAVERASPKHTVV